MLHGIALSPGTLTGRAEAPLGAATTPMPIQLRVIPAARQHAATPVDRPPHAATRVAKVPAPRSPPPPKPLQANALPPPPSQAWPTDADWTFRLQWRGDPGEATLRWQQDGQRYRLRLERQSAGRELPTWQSEGRLGSHGLLPERFWAGREGRRAQTHQQFDAPDSPWPAGTQDRLSWLWQASLQAAAVGLRPGEALHMKVAGWRGELQIWTLQAETDPDHPHWLRLRRLGREGSLLEQLLWLDPARGHRPVRLLVRFDDHERWALEAVDSAAEKPPVARLPPPGP